MVVESTALTVITLNVNGLNSPIKRHRLAEWIKKQDPSICCLQETHFRHKDKHRLKVKGWKKIFHANNNQKKAGVAILISDKLDFKSETIKRDKEGHYILIKGSIHQENITIINIYAPNQNAPKFMRQTLRSLKGEIDTSTIIVGDFNTPLSSMDRTSRQRITKETEMLNCMINELDLTDIYRTLHPTTAGYTFFSSAHGTFSRIDHMLGHKASLNGMKLEINKRQKVIKFTNIWRLNNTLLENQWVKEEITREISKYLEANDNESTTCQNLWDAAKPVLRGKFIALNAYIKGEERTKN